MKKSRILINKNFFIYNGEEYVFDRINEINHLFKPNIEIVILEENLYAKQFNDKIKRSRIYEFADYKIKNDFPQNGDILYDFQVKDNIISIYSIKGAKRIESLAKMASGLEVKPIQFIIREIMIKFLKSISFNANVLIKINKCYYFMSFNKGLFNYGDVTENKDIILNTIAAVKEEEIYIDENVTSILNDKCRFKVIKLNIGELMYEKIYEKQKFHSRKILS